MFGGGRAAADGGTRKSARPAPGRVDASSPSRTSFPERRLAAAPVFRTSGRLVAVPAREPAAIAGQPNSSGRRCQPHRASSVLIGIDAAAAAIAGALAYELTGGVGRTTHLSLPMAV